jgi:hypothetical protein
MSPFDTASMFTVYKPPDQQETQNPTNLARIEIAATVTGIIVIVALIVYYKKHI